MRGNRQGRTRTLAQSRREKSTRETVHIFIGGHSTGGTYPFLMNNLVLPLYDIVRGTSRFRYGRTLNKTQWLGPRDIESLQRRNLRCLIKHAFETVPYYRRLFREAGLVPDNIREPKDLVKLPILTKQELRKEFRNMVSTVVNPNTLRACQSGGTGDPVRFFTTKDSFSWEVAAEFRAYEWAGYKLGDKCFTFWGSPIDLAKSESLVKRFAEILERRFMADTFVISEEVLARFTYLLRRFKPRIIRGYASSVFMMAKYLKENDVVDVRPNAVITAAETLHDSMRKTIEDAFQCPVFDYYGSREVGAIAAECQEHKGYHISAENVVVEFERDGEPVGSGEKGIMLLTDLRNFGMPLIRYRIGDVGVPSEETCSCGRGLPMMSSIEGRVSDFMAFYDKESGRVRPVGPIYPVVISAAMHLPIENCQVIQNALNRLVVAIVKGKGYSQRHTEFIVEHFKKYLGNEIEIEIEFVKYIPPLKSGKRSNFISKLDPFNPRGESGRKV